MQQLTFVQPLTTHCACSPSALCGSKLLYCRALRRPRLASPGRFAVAPNDIVSRTTGISAQLSNDANAPAASPRSVINSKALGSSKDAVDGDQTLGSSANNTKSISLTHRATDSNSLPPLLNEQAQEERPATVTANIFGKSIAIPARWLLFSVPFMWGSFGPSVRLLFSHEPHLDTALFNTARLLLASMVYAPILVTEFSKLRSTDTSENSEEDKFGFLKGGVELGIYVFLANVCQVLGLESVSAGRAAFLVQLQTVMVPVLSGLFGLEVVQKKTWIASVIAFAGVALLSLDKGHGAASSLVGDSLEILTALFFSAYIIRLGKICTRVRSGPLVATKIVIQAVLSSTWVFGLTLLGHSHSSTLPVSSLPLPEWTLPILALNVGVVAWTGLVSSALSGWAQTNGQKAVPASDTVVIFATQPLWASALAALLLGETFGPRGLIGGALIVGSTLVAGMKSEEDDSTPKSKAAKEL